MVNEEIFSAGSSGEEQKENVYGIRSQEERRAAVLHKEPETSEYSVNVF